MMSAFTTTPGQPSKLDKITMRGWQHLSGHLGHFDVYFVISIERCTDSLVVCHRHRFGYLTLRILVREAQNSPFGRGFIAVFDGSGRRGGSFVASHPVSIERYF